MPWKFGAYVPSMSKTLLPTLESDMRLQQDGFNLAYISLVKALANNDTDFLKSVAEPRLFQSLKTSLDSMAEKKGSMKIVNEDAVFRPEFFNAQLRIKASIDRKPLGEVIKGDSMKPIKTNDTPRLLKEDIHIYNDSEISSIVLKVDVVYTSMFKLVMADETGEEVQGKADETPETHMLTFETESMPTGIIFPGLWHRVNSILYAVGYSNWMSEFNWIITDIDEHLNGNPYT